MNKKLKIIVLTCLIILIAAVLVLGRTKLKNKIHEENDGSANYKNAENLKKIIKNSHDFKNSNLKIKKVGNMNSVIIDEKYKVTVNDGFYVIDINDTRDASYCKIVDTIETNLGHNEGESIETCKKIIKSSIMSQSGISLDINDEKKMLIIDSKKKYELYNPRTIYNKNELINIGELEDYGIKIDNYEFLSINVSNYIEEYNNFQICVNVSDKISSNQYKITLYDKNKKEINSTNLKNINEPGMPNRYCANFTHDSNNIEYYSIGNR